MTDLKEFLAKKRYKKVKFKILKTQHLVLKAKVNGVSGWFILDTGASNSCLGFKSVTKFGLSPEHTDSKAASASSSDMFTQLAKRNIVQLSTWKTLDFTFVVFDLTHVNAVLSNYGVAPIDGIIGADILLKGKAIIDYTNHYLYLI
ncbi:retropepsin-like aspartic protease [Flavobacterium sp.]|uniref:retropepsin-like aspartic protease n=1 Tax=Flavobacterium sp. TaxID=239 RepID=UPI0025C4F66F|nr:retropepsin-like aspartic protease [Flavobacterium sp.]